MKLTAVVLTKNNQDTIVALLNNLKFANEVLVIDDNSIDQSAQLAKKNGAKVFQRNLHNNFAAQRNYALSKVRGEWILFVDSDEEISDSLKREILGVIQNTNYDGFRIRRVDTWLGKELKNGEFGKTSLIRLGKKDAGIWKRKVHEYWNISNVGILKNILIHKPHDSIHKFVTSINEYSTLHAKEHSTTRNNFIFAKMIFYPLAKFFQNYVIRKGYKDGTHGFVAAVLMSFHSFLAWSKLWTKQY